MTFEEAGRRYQQLAQQLRAGQISRQQFSQAVHQLRVQDEQSRWWQLDPATGQWLFWDGASWVQPKPPPSAQPAKPAQPEPRQKPVKAVSSAPQQSPKQPQSAPKPAPISGKDSRTAALVKRSSRWWDVVSILGGVLGAFIWTLYSGVRASYEGRDWLTPILMILIPVGLVTFRLQIDRLLLFIQPVRRKIPRPILFGAGIAAPFLVSWWLYQRWYWMTQYRYLHWSLVLGTLVSYIITRTPQTTKGDKGQKGQSTTVILILVGYLFLFLFVGTAFADDCFRDPLNANDCLRTPGTAQVIAGLATMMTAVLVNAQEIIRTLVEIREGKPLRKDELPTKDKSGGEPPLPDKETQARTEPRPDEVQSQSPERPPPESDKSTGVAKADAHGQQSSAGSPTEGQQAASTPKPESQQAASTPRSEPQQAASTARPEPQQATGIESSAAQAASAAQPPGDPPKSWFDITKLVIDYTGKIKGVADPRLIKNAEDAIRVSRRMWDVFPNKAMADKYIEAIRKRMTIDKWGGRLQKAGYIGDAVDAVIKADGVITKRGYQGLEKAGAYYVEGVNKVLVTMLTKNPVVAIADQVIGDMTGHNIESTIRAGEEGWHQVTQEYANNIYSQGAADATIQTQDNFLRYVRKLKKMTAEGQITQDEARQRARRVFDRINQ